jgi:hypothetical protein
LAAAVTAQRYIAPEAKVYFATKNEVSLIVVAGGGRYINICGPSPVHRGWRSDIVKGRTTLTVVFIEDLLRRRKGWLREKGQMRLLEADDIDGGGGHCVILKENVVIALYLQVSRPSAVPDLLGQPAGQLTCGAIALQDGHLTRKNTCIEPELYLWVSLQGSCTVYMIFKPRSVP